MSGVPGEGVMLLGVRTRRRSTQHRKAAGGGGSGRGVGGPTLSSSWQVSRPAVLVGAPWRVYCYYRAYLQSRGSPRPKGVTGTPAVCTP